MDLTYRSISPPAFPPKVNFSSFGCKRFVYPVAYFFTNGAKG